MNKLLFLDFDGVLHGTTSKKENLFQNAVQLNALLSTNPCPVVISSSWRFHYELDQIQKFLPFPLNSLIIGTTGVALSGRWPRYNEILDYLEKMSIDTDWRALDDAFLEFPPECRELIKCNPKNGLTTKEINLLSDWLI